MASQISSARSADQIRPFAKLLEARTLAFLAIFLIQCWVTLSHDAWLDEWQAWLLATQSPTLPALLANLHYEGHPPLWYLILRAASWLAPGKIALPLIALATATTTAAIIMFRSPFRLADRVMLCLGYLLLVEYGSLSRGISFGVMLMFLFVTSRSKAMRWFLIIVAPMLEMQFAVLSAFGVAVMWQEKQWDWRAAAIWVVSGLAMVALIWPAPDVQTAVALKPDMIVRILLFMVMAGNLFVPIPYLDGQIGWFGNAPGMWGAILIFAFLLMGVRATRANPYYSAAFMLLFFFNLFMAMFVYQLSIRHVGLLAILLILLVWRLCEEGHKVQIYFRAWLALSAAAGLVIAGIIHHIGFDSSNRTAAYIEQHGLKSELWASFDNAHAVSVTASLGIPSYAVNKGCMQTFIRWDRKSGEWTIESARQRLIAAREAYGPFYLISEIPFEDFPRARRISEVLQPITRIDAGYTTGSFYLYKIGSGPRKTGVSPPLCKPLDSYPR